MDNSSEHTLGNEEPVVRKFLPQFWGFLFSFAACGFAYLLIVVWDKPLPATGIVIGILGGLLILFARLNRWGVILWSIAAVILCMALQNLLNSMYPEAANTQFLVPFGLLFAMASAVCFIAVAVKDRSKRGRNLGGVILVVFTIILGGKVAAPIRNHLSGQEAIQQTTQTLIDLHRLGNEVESYRVKFGRLPRDEAEFVEFRGEPMPPFYGKYCYGYQIVGAEQYSLTCTISDAWGRHWDLFGYILEYYGPESTERIHAILF